jgi:hypothetical protein
MISRVKPSKTLCSDKRKAGPDLESIDKKIGVTKRFNNVKGFLLVCSVKFRMKVGVKESIVNTPFVRKVKTQQRKK